MKSIYGTGVALITPFNNSNEVDFDGLTKLLSHTAKGVDYYVVHGTTGESATTSPSEKKTILQHIINNNPNKLPIVAGIGGNNTYGVIETIKNTDLTGIDAVLSVAPYYNKPSQKGIIAHFTKIANESPVPIILYNVPERTSSNILASTTIELSKHTNIIGIKEASGSIEQAIEIHKNTDDDFLLISGDDMLTPTLMSVGAVGVISVLANAFPEIFRKVISHANNKSLEEAEIIIKQLANINPLMYEEGNPVGIKEVLRQIEICSNNVRLPLLPASNDLSKRIKALL
ncbi:MAG: 4-hydroxy-tetrahydrodipicolinate synthase [Cyclobacteriaceae bacterium]|nr:4-hydroxy-tetrahydrodipicolinate synthase [Cyclobacteriaceae bacterium]